MQDTFSWVGYYCGRYHDGLAGELQNSLSNVAFLIAAALGFLIWRARPERDRSQLVLIALVALIGMGSFTFHSHPNQATLQIDLIPIQVFGLASLFYLARREFDMPAWKAILVIIAFFVVREAWGMIVPRGALGGGVSHIPTILLLIGTGSWLVYRSRRIGVYLLTAAGLYCVALFARTVDVAACSSIPFGFHWLWHLATGSVAGVVLIGIVKHTESAPTKP